MSAPDAVPALEPLNTLDLDLNLDTDHDLDPVPRRPLWEEEEERMLVINDRWAAKHLPETDPEEALIRSAAIEHVRYLRCVDADERALRPAARKAMASWEEQRRHAIRRKAQGLKDDPEAVAAELRESAFGIDWMLRHWRGLLGLLDSGRGWRGDDLVLALRLMGRAPRAPDPDDVDARALWDATGRACPSTLDPAAAPGLSGDLDAADRLRGIVAETIARLESLRPIAWEHEEGPEAEAVESAAMVDTSPEGQLRQRFRREALRDMHRSLSLILRLRVERSKLDHRAGRSGPVAVSSPSGPPPSLPRPLDLPRFAPAVAAPPPPSPAPSPAPVPEPPRRNDPVPTPESDAVTHVKVHGVKRLGPPGPGPLADPGPRTGRRTEAHRNPPRVPGTGPDPASHPPGPARSRPPGDDRPA